MTYSEQSVPHDVPGDDKPVPPPQQPGYESVTITALGTRPFHLRSYAVAGISCFAAIVLTAIFWQSLSQAQFVFVAGAVVVTAWYGGFLPGIVCAIVSMALLNYFFLDPAHGFLIDPPDVIPFSLYFIVFALLSYTMEMRIRSQRALMQSREQLRAVLQGVPDAITVQRGNGSVMYANEKGAAILGSQYSQQVVDLDLSTLNQRYRLYSETDEQISMTVFVDDPLFRQGQPMERTMRRCDTDTHLERWLHVRATPICDESGFRFAVNVIQDITERRKANAEREQLMMMVDEQRQRLDNLLGNVPGVIGVSQRLDDGTFRFTYINEYAERVFGYSAHEWMATTDFMARLVHPDDQARVFGEMERLFAAGGDLSIQFRCITRQGALVYIESQSSVVVDAESGDLRVYGVMMDISASHQAETEHARLNQIVFQQALRLDKVVANVPGILWEGLHVAPGSVRVDYVNDRGVQLLGYPLSEWLETPDFFERIIHPDDLKAVQADNAHMFRTSEPLHNQFRAIAQDGHIVYLESQSSVVFDPQAGQLRVYGQLTDITERKQDEIEQERLNRLLAEQSKRLDSLFANITSIVYEAEQMPGQPPRIVAVNAAAERMLGYNLDLWNDIPAIYQQVTHPDDYERVVSARVGAFRQEGHVNTEFRAIRSDGQLIDIELQSSTTIDPDTGVARIYGIMTDITERKRAHVEEVRLNSIVTSQRERLRNLIMNVPGVIWEAILLPDRTLRIDFVNDTAEKMFGYTTQEWRGPEFFPRLIHPEDRDQAFSKAIEMFETRGMLVNQFRCITKSGETLHVEAQSSASIEERTGVLRIYALMMDITARKQVEQKLAQSALELSRSNQELQQFAYVASHDLQEPLRMVTSYLQLLEQRYSDKLDEDAHEFIGYAIDGAARMKILIGDLLAYSRVDSRGKQFTAVPLGRAAQQAIRSLSLIIEERQAQVEVGELPTLLGDETQLTQVFQNLIANALKFCEQTPHISITAQRSGPFWQISVRDNGVGMEPQYLERIFVIFQRLHSKARYPGTGIGLAICKKVIERHGGQIWVESVVGQGSTFHFTLPLRTTRELRREPPSNRPN